MSIRITIGKNQIKQDASDSSSFLKNLYASRDLLIQGDCNVKVIKNEGFVHALFLGNVIGRNQENGCMLALHERENSFDHYIVENSMETCVSNLEGRYVLIKISNVNDVEISCDSCGQMDLYYQEIDNGAIFSTDLSLLPFSRERVGLDQIAMAHSLYIYGFRPAKRQTLYSGVKRLGVGESVSWRNGQLGFDQIPYKLLSANPEYGDQELRKYSQILLDAVEKRSSAEGNVVYLSSGWDSTAILAYLVKIHGPSKVSAIIGRMNYSERRGVINQFELDRAKVFADYYGVKLDIVEYDYWQRGPEFLEEMRPLFRSHMFSGMSAYLWDDLARHVSKYHKGKSVFCGEISDGVHNFGFTQYATILNHLDLGFREYADKMGVYLFGPTFLRALQSGDYKKDIVYNTLKGGVEETCFDKAEKNTSGCMKQLMSSMFLRDKRLPLWSVKNANIFTVDGGAYYSEVMENMYIKELAENATPESLYACYQRLYNSFHWQGGTVSSLAVTANKYGFEINMPFYDSRIHSFLAQMPESWGRGLELRPTKYPLKWTLENCIDYPIHLQKGPHSYLYDIDPDFSHAGEFIYQSSFTPFMKETLKSRNYEGYLSSEIFNLDYYNQIVTNYLEGKEVSSEKTDLSTLIFLSLTSWYGSENA